MLEISSPNTLLKFLSPRHIPEEQDLNAWNSDKL